MSFGIGVGDFIAVGTLAWKVYKNVYKAAKDAPESFQKVHHDVLSLHAVLKEAGEIIFDSPMSSQTQQRLRTIADGCTSVLDDLQCLVNRYEEMGTPGKLTWKRFRWGSEDIVEYRLRITSSVTMLNAFMSTSQAVTQQKLERYLREVQLGRREGSIMSVQTVDSLSKEDRAAWRAIRKELESIGITAEAYEANHDFIRDWLTRALDAGALDEQAISVTEENKTIEIESSPPLRRSHLSPNSKMKTTPSGSNHRPPRGCSSPLSNSGRAYDHDPDPEGEPSSKVDAKGPKIPKAGEQGRTSKAAVKNQPVSRVAALVAMISRPKLRLLQLARSPVASPELSHILQNPATRRLIDAETMERAFLEACFVGSPESVLKLLEEGQQVNAIVRNQFPMVAKSMIGDDGRRLLSAAPEGASALMLAALHGKRRAIQVLLRWGADINFETFFKYCLTQEQTSDKVYMAVPPFTKLRTQRLSENYLEEGQIFTKDANYKVHP
ncbi:MAG: hypothetical protein L6R42_005361 [Xanthoria sp. 1 TBL-2021]|nr:MAG: hypothetical protein L6R42_005361 [Xanthoria sp. 1 TBL-2021]